MAVPGNPLDYWGSDPGNPLSQGAPTWADAVDAYGRLIAQQRQRDIDAGLIDPATGWPTRQGAMQSAMNMGMGLGTSDLPGGIRAYHGSPYSFDAFDASKIGTGEGAQAYGHGLYFAENEGVARGYRDALSPLSPGAAAGNTGPAGIASRALQGSTPEDAIAALQGRLNMAHIQKGIADGDPEMLSFRDDVNKAIDIIRNPASRGSMYEVNIGSDPQHFLDWDKPLSEQSQHVQDALASHPKLSAIIGDTAPTEAMQRGWERQPTAGDWVRQTTRGRTGEMDPAELSLMLRDAGIPGISYFDAGSRSAGQGSRNHVVFDPATIDILRKYGIAGLGLGLGAAATQGNAQQQ